MLTLVSALCLSSTTFAASGSLEDKSFCRTVDSGGFFGQLKGARLNCLPFSSGNAADDSNTFLGNPAKSAEYVVTGNKVTFGISEYDLPNDHSQLTTVKGSTTSGIVYTLKQ